MSNTNSADLNWSEVERALNFSNSSNHLAKFWCDSSFLENAKAMLTSRFPCQWWRLEKRSKAKNCCVKHILCQRHAALAEYTPSFSIACGDATAVVNFNFWIMANVFVFLCVLALWWRNDYPASLPLKGVFFFTLLALWSLNTQSAETSCVNLMKD